jgi:hypothetical protein
MTSALPTPDPAVPSDDTRLFRYYPRKRIDQLFGGALFLPTFGKLRELDPFEAALVAGELAHLDRVNREHPFKPHLARQMDDVTARNLYVSCWCGSDHEGIDMWHRYVGEEPDGGVAIVSDVRSLREALADVDSPVTIRRCSYDFDMNHEGHVTGHDLHFRKRRCYEHEKEVRAVFVHPYRPKDGYLVLVDPVSLIHEVRLCPGASEKFRRAVEAMMEEHGIPPDRLRRSEMDVRPPEVPLR